MLTITCNMCKKKMKDKYGYLVMDSRVRLNFASEHEELNLCEKCQKKVYKFIQKG